MDSTGIAMNSTAITLSDALKSRLAKGHIGGKEVNLEFIPETIQAAGALYSTANDLLKYLAANMGKNISYSLTCYLKYYRSGY
jgi:CubicO group peptidase (beta-lactamase class C family)